MTKNKRSRAASALGHALESYESERKKRKEEANTRKRQLNSRSSRVIVGGSAPDDGKNNFDRSEIIGTKRLLGSSEAPATFGPRSLCTVHQPGSGKFNFQPKTCMSNFITNRQHLTFRPQNSNPMNESQFTIIFEQLPGLFYDTNEMYLDFDAQMFYQEEAWKPDGSNLGLKYQNCITPVNNVGPSLFKDLVVNINNQQLCQYRLCDLDYFQTILNTGRKEYESGYLMEKGFFKETAGHMTEWNCGADQDNTNPPVNANNEARAKLAGLFFMGKKAHFRFKLMFLLTQNHNVTPFNFGNRLTLTFTRSSPSYYLLTGPNGSPIADLETKAAKCSIQLSNVKMDVVAVELGEAYMKEYMKEYIQSYTDMQPDQYRFSRHSMQTYNYTKGHQQYDVRIAVDKIPDKIAMTVQHMAWNTGSLLVNPHIMYKLPAKGKLQFYVNTSSMWNEMLKTEDHRSVYRRMKEAMMPNNDEVLITVHDVDVNDKTAESDSGYNFYADTLTFTTVNKDGSITEDMRTAGLMWHLEFEKGITLPDNRVIKFHLFDERTFGIQPNGQMTKDYLT